MSRLPLFASSPIFPLTSQTPTTLLEHDEHLGPDEGSHRDDLRQSGGFRQTVTPTHCGQWCSDCATDRDLQSVLSKSTSVNTRKEVNYA